MTRKRSLLQAFANREDYFGKKPKEITPNESVERVRR
jgi:hypothetical protein